MTESREVGMLVSERDLSPPSKMKTCSPLRRLTVIGSLAIGALSMPTSPATAATLSPVTGFLKFLCPGGSDTVVSVPFHRSPRWDGLLSGPPVGAGAGRMRLDLAGSPAFAGSELTDAPHWLYCRDGGGAKGRHFLVVARGADFVELQATAADLDGLTTNGRISLIPAWTLAGLFPPGAQTAFHPSTGPLLSQRGSELLTFDANGNGSSLAPAHRYYVTNSAWQEVGEYAADAGGTVLAPGEAFVVRHATGSLATTLLFLERVYGETVTLPLRIGGAWSQDTMLALPRPVTIALDQLDFGAGQFTESSSTDPADRKDELLVYDSLALGLNKMPAITYFRTAGQWVKAGPNTPAGAETIAPASGLLIRKAPGGAPAILQWANLPTYDLTAP